MEILRITQNENCAVDELARVIQSDPALTARLLQVANSALSGGARPCATIKEATMRLGLRSVRSIALGFSLVSAHRNGHCAAFDYGVFWAHSLARAVAAHALSSRFGVGVPAEVFVAALLSDLGSVALATVHPVEFGEILRQPESATSNGRAVLEQERFGIDHREVTAAMVREWHLPEPFALAAVSVGAIEPPFGDSKRGPSLTLITWIAARFAAAFVIPDDKPLEVELVQKALVRFPGYENEHLPGLWGEMADAWRTWGNLLEIVVSAVPPYAGGTPSRARIGCPLLVATPPAIAVLAAKTAPAVAPTGPVVVGSKSPAVPASAPVNGATPAVAPVAGSSARIVVVDDEPIMLRTLSSLLQRAGHQVTPAANGKQALELVMRLAPQIVIADRQMPEIGGVQLCKNLRQYEAGRRIYFVLLTSDESEDHIVEAFDAGADDYVVNPFRPRLLLARVRSGMRVVRMQERIDADKATMQKQVAALGVLARRLETAAVTDVLTDLPNRRFAISAMKECWDNSVASSKPYSAIMVDIDKFKRVNDTFGHDIGDLVLKETAKTLKIAIEPPNHVCRLGGEEFVVILPGSTGDEARAIGEKLRGAVESHPIKGGGFDGHITASFGVATRDATVRDSEQLLKMADDGLYRAKDSGRNQVRFLQAEGKPVEPLAPAPAPVAP